MSAPNGAADLSPEAAMAVAEFVLEDAEARGDLPPAAVILLGQIDARLARIEEKIAAYEPLIDMVRQRADRGSVWRRNRGESG